MVEILPRVLAVLPNISPTAEIATIRPLNQLVQQGLVAFRVVLENEVTSADVRWADMVVLVRNAGIRSRAVVEEARACGVPTVYDLDDNLWEVPPDSPSKVYHSTAIMRFREELLSAVDLVKVYNPILAERVRQDFNQNVYIAVAGIDFSLAQGVSVQNKLQKIRIVYATARGAQDPLYRLIGPDLRRLLIEQGPKVELVLWRERPAVLAGLPNIRVFPAEADYEKFMHQLIAGEFDIGLAPLENTVFYNSKTNAKFRDYGLAKIAGIYSDTPIYRDVKDGVTGLVVGLEDGAWYQAIRRLIDNRDLRESIQTAAYEYVHEYFSQDRMVAQWLEMMALLGVHRSAECARRGVDGLRIPIDDMERIDFSSEILSVLDKEDANIQPVKSISDENPTTFGSGDAVTSLSARRLSVLGLFYHLRIPQDRWNTLVVQFGTYQRPFEGSVKAIIRQARFPYKILRNVKIYSGEIVDNELCGIYFDPIEGIAGKDVLVHLTAQSANLPPLLAVYEMGARKEGISIINGLNFLGGRLHCALFFLPQQDTQEN